MEKSLFHLYKNPVYVGKMPVLSQLYIRKIRTIYTVQIAVLPAEPYYPGCEHRSDSNSPNDNRNTPDFYKDETEFPNIQMPFGVHTVSDREL